MTDLRKERIKYITAVVLYGTIGMFVRFVSLPSEEVALCRGLFGSLFILLYLKLTGQHMDRKAVRRNAFWLVMSGISLGLNWIFLFAAYVTTTVAIASLCNYMAPLIVILIAPFVLNEKLNVKKLPWVGLALIGIILVSGVIGNGPVNPRGLLMGMLAALGFTGVVICNRKIRDISALDKSVIQLAISAVTILPYVLVMNHGLVIPADLRSVLIVLMLGIVHTGFAYCLYFSGISTLPVQTVAILGYLEPVVSIFCSAFFLQEAMSISGWIGASMIIFAALMSETGS